MNAKEIVGREEKGLPLHKGVIARGIRRVSSPVGLRSVERQTPEL